jgi:hypothetical protein
MTTYADIEKARKLLKESRAAKALFMEQHKNHRWSPKDEAEHLSLVTAELNATIHISDLELGGAQGRAKR